MDKTAVMKNASFSDESIIKSKAVIAMTQRRLVNCGGEVGYSYEEAQRFLGVNMF